MSDKKPRITLDAEPHFTSSVDIPVAGHDPIPLEFTFKHRTREERDEWVDGLDKREGSAIEKDVSLVMDMADGWELKDDFNAKNVRVLLNKYAGSAHSIYLHYLRELQLGKQKNL